MNEGKPKKRKRTDNRKLKRLPKTNKPHDKKSNKQDSQKTHARAGHVYIFLKTTVLTKKKNIFVTIINVVCLNGKQH